MNEADGLILRQLLDEYLEMYASRDDRLTARFSEDFSGFTGGGDFLVKDREAWVAITRQDFAQVRERIRLELKDVSIQSLSDTVAVTTAFFRIHLPIADHVLSREMARLVLIFRKEPAAWQICHSSISIPYHLVREGEVYPLAELVERNRALEEQIALQTADLSEANERLQRANEALAEQIAAQEEAAKRLRESEALFRSIIAASPDGITITDVEGRVLMVSEKAVAMFGLDTAEQSYGLPVTDFLVPEDREVARTRIAGVPQGIPSGPTEYRGLRRDRTTFDVEVNSGLILGSDGQSSKLVAMIRDITARKQTEAELRAAVHHIRTLSGLLPICVYCKKIRDDEGEWRPVEVYVRDRTEAEFSHGLCPDCLSSNYPEFADDDDPGTARATRGRRGGVV